MSVHEIRSRLRRSGLVSDPQVTQSPLQEESLDRDLTDHREGARWTFSNDKILIDGYDVNQLITYDSSDVGVWMGLAHALEEYRRRIFKKARDRDPVAKFDAVVDSLLGKIMGRLKRVYDQKMSGVAWSIENGQLILNGINIGSFLSLYRVRKTEKAKQFLKGLRQRLAVLLENREESPGYERIRDHVQSLFEEMDRELASEDQATSRTARALPSPRSRLS